MDLNLIREDNKKTNSSELNHATAAETDDSLYKIAILAACGVMLASAFSYYLKFFIAEGGSYFWISSAAAVLFLAVFLLNVFFIKSFRVSTLTVLIESLGLVLGFYDNISSVIILATVISFLILVLAAQAGREESRNLLKIKFRRISKRTLPKAILALALFSSAAYYASVSGPSVSLGGSEKFFISKSTFNNIISPFAPIVKNFIPGFDSNTRASDFIRSLTTKQVEDNSEAAILPAAVKQKLIDKSSGDLEDQINKFAGATLDFNKSTSDVLYAAMVKKIGGFPQNIQNAIPILLSLLVFLAILSFAWLIRWIAGFISFLVYEILIVTGFAAVATESRVREIVVLR